MIPRREEICKLQFSALPLAFFCGSGADSEVTKRVVEAHGQEDAPGGGGWDQRVVVPGVPRALSVRTSASSWNPGIPQLVYAGRVGGRAK